MVCSTETVTQLTSQYLVKDFWSKTLSINHLMKTMDLSTSRKPH